MAGILIVDDDASARHIIVRSLYSLGAETSQAVNGEEAIALLGAKAYDLVISDIRMPSLDGFGLLEFVYKGNFDIPVIFISAFAEDDDIRQRLWKVGAFDFIAKPINGEELQNKVNKALLFGKYWVIQHKKKISGTSGDPYSSGV